MPVQVLHFPCLPRGLEVSQVLAASPVPWYSYRSDRRYGGGKHRCRETKCLLLLFTAELAKAVLPLASWSVLCLGLCCFFSVKVSSID